jgi:hypothetical protein
LSGRLWVLLGARAGDNAQAVLLAERVGGAFETKQLGFNALHHLPFWGLGASLASLTEGARAAIAPPWPDMAIAAGRRSVPAARHIRKASHGKTKLVHIGRPRAPLDLFDLVVTTPQYGLPAAPNVVELPLPLVAARPEPEETMDFWREAWRDLPRPWTALAVGAGKYPLRMDRPAIADLGRKLAALPGGLIAMASPRTEEWVLPMLADTLAIPARFYPWGQGQNPYRTALALADRIVVTSDSLSMLAEAVASGKPVSVFKLPLSPLHVSWQARHGLAAWLARRGLLHPPRNVPAVVDRLIAADAIAELGSAATAGGGVSPDHGTAIARVRALLAE